jgi:hypothetical protein
MIFKKKYNIEVEIDLEKCNNDFDYALEDWEFDGMQKFHDELADDLWTFMAKEGLANG